MYAKSRKIAKPAEIGRDPASGLKSGCRKREPIQTLCQPDDKWHFLCFLPKQ